MRPREAYNGNAGHAQARLPDLCFDMHNFIAWAKRFLGREDGPSAVEYALVLALIVVACVVSITALGSRVTKSFKKQGMSTFVASIDDRA